LIGAIPAKFEGKLKDLSDSQSKQPGLAILLCIDTT
jgi:hypothetical protein